MAPGRSFRLSIYPDMKNYFRRSPSESYDVDEEDVFEAVAAWLPDVLFVRGTKYPIGDLNEAVAAALTGDTIHVVEKVAAVPRSPSPRASSSRSATATSASSSTSRSSLSKASSSATAPKATVIPRHRPKPSEMPSDLYGKAPTPRFQMSRKRSASPPQPQQPNNIIEIGVTNPATNNPPITFNARRASSAVTFIDLLSSPVNRHRLDEILAISYTDETVTLEQLLGTFEPPHSRKRRPLSFLLSSAIDDTMDKRASAAKDGSKKAKLSQIVYLFKQKQDTTVGKPDASLQSEQLTLSSGLGMAAADEYFAISDRLVAASRNVSSAMETSAAYHYLIEFIFRAVEMSIRLAFCHLCRYILVYPLYAHDDCCHQMCGGCLSTMTFAAPGRCRPSCSAGLCSFPENRSAWTESLASLNFRPYIQYLQSLDPEDAQRVWERLLPMDDAGAGYLSLDEVGNFQDFLDSITRNENIFQMWQDPPPPRVHSRRSFALTGSTGNNAGGHGDGKVTGAAGEDSGKADGALESYLLSGDEDEPGQDQGPDKPHEPLRDEGRDE